MAAWLASDNSFVWIQCCSMQDMGRTAVEARKQMLSYMVEESSTDGHELAVETNCEASGDRPAAGESIGPQAIWPRRLSCFRLPLSPDLTRSDADLSLSGLAC